MRHPDAFDMEEADERGGDPQDVTCKRCGAEDLSWHHTGVRWILIDQNARNHVCAPSADDFDAIPGG